MRTYQSTNMVVTAIPICSEAMAIQNISSYSHCNRKIFRLWDRDENLIIFYDRLAHITHTHTTSHIRPLYPLHLAEKYQQHFCHCHQPKMSIIRKIIAVESWKPHVNVFLAQSRTILDPLYRYWPCCWLLMMMCVLVQNIIEIFERT